MVIGDFVPYIWLTNSERAFLWFADSDEGWFTDDDSNHPTQEIRRENGTVTLRVHFIEVPTSLEEPTTVEYGYQAFPSRPLPEGWRSIVCSGRSQYLPDGRNTYFWFDGDWAVLWPYYSSPYPWSFERSRDLFERYPTDSTHRPMVGSIAHSIGRYRDAENHWFKEYAVDWGQEPGNLSNANVTQNKGTIDFRLYHYREWVRRSGFRGLYVDENYISFDRNFLSGGAYIRPDGQLQVGYSYIGLREYFKRFKYMMEEEGAPSPNLWQHISSGAAYHSWFGDVFFEGENVEPTNLEFDYIRVLPAERMRAIGSSRCSGGAMTMMCQSQRHKTIYEPKHTHQFVGWVMAHDILPEQVREYEIMAQEAQFWKPTEFIPYWHADSPFKTDAADTVISAHRNDARTMIWVVNTSRDDQDVNVSLDWTALGMKRAGTVALNAETGARIKLTGRGFSVPVLKRDYVAVHMLPAPNGEEKLTFRATFENSVKADYAYGSVTFVHDSGSDDRQLTRTAGVNGGKALAVPGSVAMWPHLSLTDREGTLRFEAHISEKPDGTIVELSSPGVRRPTEKPTPAIEVTVEKDNLVFGMRDKNTWVDGQAAQASIPSAGWHQFELAWSDGQVTLAVDGEPAGTIKAERLNICSGTGKQLLESGNFVFGGRRSAITAIDEVECYRE